MEGNYINPFDGGLGGMFKKNEGGDGGHGDHGSHGGHDERGNGSNREVNRDLPRKQEANFFTNVEKGSDNEILYRVLAEEVPELGVVLREEAYGGSRNDFKLENHSGIIIPPSDFKDTFLAKLKNDPILSFFTGMAQDNASRELAIRGHLSINTYERYKLRVKERHNKNGLGIDHDSSSSSHELTPLSDDEIKDILRAKIKDIYAEYKKFQNKKIN